MDVSVIIVNYNTLQMTQECIDSVFEKTKDVEYEVILVDNASTDGSKEHFENNDRIRYIYSNENLGFGRANNLGYKYATGKYIFLLNSDTLLLNNAIFEFYKYMNSASPNIGCVGCELVNLKGKATGSFGKFPDIRNFLGRILVSYKMRIPFLLGKSHSAKKYPCIVDYVTGADLFIRRNVIEKCGFFDPDFFMYFEETEMQYRFKKNGYMSHIIDVPHIIHLQGASNVNKSNKGKRSLKVASIELESRFIYCRKTNFNIRIISLIHLLLIPRILLYNASWAEKREMIETIFFCRDL